MSLSDARSNPGQPPRPYSNPNGPPHRSDLPTLPSMSSILNPMGSDVSRNPYAPSQFEPSYNAEHQDLLAAQSAHELLSPYQAPIPQCRQSRKITQRRADNPKDYGQDFRQFANSSYERRDSSNSQIKPEATNPSGSRSSTFSNSSPAEASSQTQRMPISGLLSDEPTPSYQPISKPQFSIRVRQQPLAARACGFGERDRRVIDPPPILQMDVTHDKSTPEELIALSRQPYAVVHCTLWDPLNDRDDTAMPGTTDKRQQRRLMGTLVASPFFGKDEHGHNGCFFTFPDLSVRTPGTYSLQFKLVILDPRKMQRGHCEVIRSTVKSGIFQVFNAKDFSGMRPSTELTKTLKHQGCLISVKKGNTKAASANTKANTDEYEDEDIDED